MQISFNELFRSFRRSWVHHTGMQLATLSVLAATFTVVAFMLVVSINLKRLLSHWGDSVQMTVYLDDAIEADDIQKVQDEIARREEFKDATFVPKEKATEIFKRQMASYAPDLLDDSEFSNPFPASFQLAVNEAVIGGNLVARLEEIAASLSHLPGVEDVSFGQGWVRNYSAFVGAVSASGWFVVVILTAGSLFVIGNSVRSSIAARRDEIEILELVGATNSMIRAPFVFEGAMMGLIASAVSIAINFGLYAWETKLLESTLTLSRLVPDFTFFGAAGIAGLLAGGAFIGGAGAYLTVCQINDGWSARQRLES